MRNSSRHHPLKAIRIPLAAALLLLAAGSANAAVEITIDKNTQTMNVAVDGVHKWTFPVSSGLPAHETPSGTFRAFRMEADHFSKEWDDAPMPHSIFFTKIGHAIHGTDAAKHLGMPASHGCVRLSRENAAKLYALVEQQGVLNTTVTLTGSSQIALARGRQGIDVASANQPPARRPLGLTPAQPADDDDLANDPYDYQRLPPPQGYQQNYGPAYRSQADLPPPPPQGYVRGGYVGRGYVEQPYPQQGYAYSQGGGTIVQQPQAYPPQVYGGDSYPNYPGYSHGPRGYYYGN